MFTLCPLIQMLQATDEESVIDPLVIPCGVDNSAYAFSVDYREFCMLNNQPIVHGQIRNLISEKWLRRWTKCCRPKFGPVAWPLLCKSTTPINNKKLVTLDPCNHSRFISFKKYPCTVVSFPPLELVPLTFLC